MTDKVRFSQIVRDNVNMVDFLTKLGYHGIMRGSNMFYNSPLRDERTPSFSVHPTENLWKDFGDGRAGNIIDFGALKFGSVSKFYDELRKHYPNLFNGSHPLLVKDVTPNPDNSEKKRHSEIQIKVTGVRSLYSYPLLRYLHERRIPQEIAVQYCKEVTYEVKGKTYYAIGFKNDEGGYALRNKHMKQATVPNSHTLINNSAKDLVVFEGFFDFLSYKTMYHNQAQRQENYLILNSTSFFNKCLPIMQEYDKVRLFLDNDKTGDTNIKNALKLDKAKFSDERALYKNYNDLNAMLTSFGVKEKPKQQHRL